MTKRLRSGVMSRGPWRFAALSTVVVLPLLGACTPAELARWADGEMAAPAAPDASAAPAWTVWDDLAECESGGDWAIDTGNGYFGGLQFSAGTWRAVGGEEFAPMAHEATREQQIAAAERVLAEQGWGAWPSCSRQLGLR